MATPDVCSPVTSAASASGPPSSTRCAIACAAASGEPAGIGNGTGSGSVICPNRSRSYRRWRGGGAGTAGRPERGSGRADADGASFLDQNRTGANHRRDDDGEEHDVLK